MAEDSLPAKPRLVFFRYRYDQRLPRFLHMHARDHVTCLSHFFDVTVVQDDCDYDAVCDRYQPALTLFESGVNHVTCRRPHITNTGSHPRIPRLGFHNADGFCNARAGFLSDMARWGIETFFAISTTAAEHTPEIADDLFVWPNFIDPELYRDYGGWKSIPVLLSGNTHALYPWRRNIGKLLSDRFPSLICPHPGYAATASRVEVLDGERYARTLSASSIVPTCGTVARDIVRKHFEIPACGACLLTERSPALEAAGFTDMENCVFADEDDVVDKVLGLFRSPEALEKITSAGHALVHARHTFRQRSQILQWLLLSRTLRPHERIVQPGPFEPLVTVPASAGGSAHLRGDGLHLALLRDGDAHFRGARYADAKRLYATCVNYMPWMPEPRLRMALCHLVEGDALRAHALVEPLLEFTLGHYRAFDPDPVEWAYFIVTALCLGRTAEARERALAFPWVRHPELDRARWLTLVARGGRDRLRPDAAPPRPRRTIHQLPDRTFDEWLVRVCAMLRACGRGALADTAQAVATAPALAGDPRDQDRLDVPGRGPRWPRDPRRGFRRRVTFRAVTSRARSLAAALVRRVDRVRLRAATLVRRRPTDPLYRTLVALIRDKRLGSALIVGAAPDRPSTRAFLAEASRRGAVPVLFCVSRATPGAGADRTGRATPHWYVLPTDPAMTLDQSIAHTLRAVMEERQRDDAFDAVVIDPAGLGHTPGLEVLRDTLKSTDYVILDGINDRNHDTFQRLIADPDYRLVACEPGVEHGYGVLRRRRRRTAAWSPWSPY